MAKSTELAPATSKFRDISSIMKDPQAKAELSNYIDEAVACKGAIATQQAHIKAIRDAAIKELELNPKLFNAFLAAAFNNDYQTRKASLEEQVTLLEYIMGESGFIADSNDD